MMNIECCVGVHPLSVFAKADLFLSVSAPLRVILRASSSLGFCVSKNISLRFCDSACNFACVILSWFLRKQKYFSAFLRLCVKLCMRQPICNKQFEIKNLQSLTNPQPYMEICLLKLIKIMVPLLKSCISLPSICRVSKSTSCVPNPVPFAFSFTGLPTPLSLIFS